MKKTSLFISGMTAVMLILGTLNIAKASDHPYAATQVSKEDAAKKYPLPAGKKNYPNGTDEAVLKGTGTAAHSGFIVSPYSPRVYDCRKIGTGALILDESVKKLFVRP